MAGTTSPSPSTQGNQLYDNLILDTPISSNPSSSPSGTDTHASPSSKIPSPKTVPIDSVVLSPGDDKAGGGDAGVITVSALTESKEGTSNILQSEAEIIEGFIISLGAREKDVGEESPSAEGRRPGSWDGTPTQPDMEIPITSAPLEIIVGVSSPPDDDEVPIHLVFKRKLRAASRPARRRVTRQTVLDEESPSSPVVDLDCGTPSQPTDESSKTEKKAHCGGGISKKGKKPAVVGKYVEGPGAPVRKHVIAKRSKAQWRGTEEIERLTMLVAQKDAEIAVLKASQSSTVPGALSDLQEENARLKSANASLKIQLEELTHQMICDQRAANERIDKLLAKL
ncbi:hypothetical protein HAX54_019765 [Datura stramonium]|uniref:Uncharacterized protein n=1 Tax=Datura stramonium TaxID=4076 RepID=A0ABS8S2E4_DATST|nr:hypothetical protein [Datura stramonium]